MSLIGNIIWIIFGGGLALAFEYFAAGVLLCITVVGIPFGLQCFKLSVLSLFPFGSEVKTQRDYNGCLALLLNLIWIFTGGLIICLTHLFFAILCAITIIGIPFALQHFKLAGLAISPFGSVIK